ncbi:hypothetical protein H257_14177 [Aphanomyces astaci]|uniref:MULE transposase domain-containing protein n=1 Tax=Aphanomyces astaci TaxID=112090 RepID=W4FTX0_APHAT|nr:hypothetical protein H257_14177 [Aphanomyces astaci]ETV70274.1 hypothetical protein H257_14177 [Aphanomyces astaci]|eukprot:XP_009840233.1 hypothetical protein H257_14177 [Aphanomyces astaci]
MKERLLGLISYDPQRKPAALYRFIEAMSQAGRFDQADHQPSPTLRQVTNAVKRLRSSTLGHVSTDQALRQELTKWLQPGGVADASEGHPFVFGVPLFTDGFPQVGDGSDLDPLRIEWDEASKDIYRMHTAFDRVYLDFLARSFKAKWNGMSQGVRKFRLKFFGWWMPPTMMANVPLNDTSCRFWKWQVYHTALGAATTKNHNEQFNAEIKRALGHQRLRMVHLVQVLLRLLRSESDKAIPFWTTPRVGERLLQHFKHLQRPNALDVNEAIEDGPNIWNYITRHVQRLEYNDQPTNGCRVKLTNVQCNCGYWYQSGIFFHLLAVAFKFGRRLPAFGEDAPSVVAAVVVKFVVVVVVPALAQSSLLTSFIKM